MANPVASARSTAKGAGSSQGIVVMAMMVAGVILYKRSKNYTTEQNVGHAVGLLTTSVALVFVADIGGGTIAAGLAVLIVLAVAYKEKKPAVAAQGTQKSVSTAQSTAPVQGNSAQVLKNQF